MKTVLACLATLIGSTAALAQTVPPEWGSVWLYRLSEEMPPWCLELREGGKAEFIGEYLHLNPATWKRDAESGDLALTFASLDDMTAQNLQWYVDHYYDGPGPHAFAKPTAFDKSTRTMRYRIRPENQFIEFSGHVLARPEALVPEQFRDMPTRCWSGPPPGAKPKAPR